MTSVQTFPVLQSDSLATRFEPCDRFIETSDIDPICGDCGWLHDEHAAAGDQSPSGTPR